jgi:hypothetical protein
MPFPMSMAIPTIDMKGRGYPPLNPLNPVLNINPPMNVLNPALNPYLQMKRTREEAVSIPNYNFPGSNSIHLNLKAFAPSAFTEVASKIQKSGIDLTETTPKKQQTIEPPKETEASVHHEERHPPQKATTTKQFFFFFFNH